MAVGEGAAGGAAGGAAAGGAAAGGAAAGGAAAGGAAAAGAAAAGTPWYQGVAGIDNELVGHITTKGWHVKTPTEVAVEAIRSHREAERMLGAPASEVVRLPKDATDPAWGSVWQRLGRPADANGYDLSGVKFADGTALDEGFATFVKDTAFKLNLPAGATVDLTREFAKYLEASDARDTASTSAALQVEREALAKNWGANFEANKIVAQNAVRALGVKPEAVAALEGTVGYAAVMEMFRTIGSKIGEDRFITNNGAGNGNGMGGAMTRDQAIARIADLKKDEAWVKSYLSGDAEKTREFANLHKLAM